MNLKNKFAIAFSFLVFSTHFGQTSNGEIVISEAHVQQLANKLYALKLERNPIPIQATKVIDKKIYISHLDTLIETDTLLYRKLISRLKEDVQLEKNDDVIIEEKTSTTRDTKQDSIYIVSQQNSKNGETKEKSNPSEPANNPTNQEILNRLTAIENQIANLEFPQNETVVVAQENVDSDKRKEDKKTLEKLGFSGIAAMQLSQKKALNEVNAKLDSLLKISSISNKDTLLNTEPTSPKDSLTGLKNQELESLKNQIYLLHAKLNRVLHEQIDKDAAQKVEKISTQVDTVYVDRTKTIDTENEAYEARKLEYGSYFRQVFFANNSTQVEAAYQELISDLVTKLQEEPKIDVSIAGYASKTGNEDYNQKISMQRALALKTKLMQEGISPKRILTDFRGIDFEASSLAQARRLDIEFVIRK